MTRPQAKRRRKEHGLAGDATAFRTMAQAVHDEVCMGRGVRTSPAAHGYGLAYGVLWRVLGALIAMPATLGMPAFAVNTTAFQSLMGHLVLGAVFVWTTRRAS